MLYVKKGNLCLDKKDFIVNISCFKIKENAFSTLNSVNTEHENAVRYLISKIFKQVNKEDIKIILSDAVRTHRVDGERLGRGRLFQSIKGILKHEFGFSENKRSFFRGSKRVSPGAVPAGSKVTATIKSPR